MTTVSAPPGDARPQWVRLVVWVGLALTAVLAPVFLLFGLVLLEHPAGRFFLCFGLVLLIGAIGGTAREVTERRLVRNPVQPRLDRLPDGEPALLLPRATAPTAISSWVLVGFGAVLVLGAGFAAVERSWGLAVVVALAAAWLGLTAMPHRAAEMAGGLWLSPTRIVDAYRGIRWELPWPDATGVDAQNSRRVLLVARRDRVPPIERTGPRGRAWKPILAGNVLVIDTNHLAGGSRLVGELLEQGLTDPASRTTLGAG